LNIWDFLGIIIVYYAPKTYDKKIKTDNYGLLRNLDEFTEIMISTVIKNT